MTATREDLLRFAAVCDALANHSTKPWRIHADEARLAAPKLPAQPHEPDGQEQSDDARWLGQLVATRALSIAECGRLIRIARRGEAAVGEIERLKAESTRLREACAKMTHVVTTTLGDALYDDELRICDATAEEAVEIAAGEIDRLRQRCDGHSNVRRRYINAIGAEPLDGETVADTAKRVVTDLRADSARLAKELEDAKREKSKVLDDGERLIRRLEAAEKDRDGLARELATAKRDMDRLHGELGEREDRACRAENERDDLARRLAESEQQVRERIEEATRLDAARDKAWNRVDLLKREVDDLRNAVSSWRAWCSKTLGHGSWCTDDEGRAALDQKLSGAGVTFTDFDVQWVRTALGACAFKSWADEGRSLANRLERLVKPEGGNV